MVMSDSTGTRYIEITRNEDYAYGVHIFDKEFISHWVKALPKPKTPEQIQESNDRWFVMDYERRVYIYPKSITPSMVEEYKKLKKKGY